MKNLCHIASGVSFTFENLSKPVIFTTGFKRIDFCNNDSAPNLFGSIMLAGNYSIPEVCIYCNDRLLRANRVKRQSSDSTNLYDSPNYPPLAKVADEVSINWENILNLPFPGEEFTLNLQFGSKITTILLTPQINEEIIDEAYGKNELQDKNESSESFPSNFISRGVILESFGTGKSSLRKVISTWSQPSCLMR